MTPPCPPQGENSLAHLAVIGDPISHSLSPVLHNFLIAHFNLPFSYEALHVRAADLPKLVARLRNGELAGVNVTIPHKQAIIPLLDELLYPADRIGAVNTVCVVHERLIGHNTDASGFQRSLEKARLEVSNQEVLLLGAGGAAKAVVFALLAKGVRSIYLCNRHEERARQLHATLPASEQNKVRVISWDGREKHIDTHGIRMIINATSVGMSTAENDAPLPAFAFREGMVALDLIYNPAETCFLRQARQAGAVTLNGLPMLIYQGVAALELWSGKTLEIAEDYAALARRMQAALP
ncbi:shikimate dehydrogenase [candidate division KSB1 bacterium]|nr:shikimate dehydrogenase [candidate division KSB1 bacterium]